MNAAKMDLAQVRNIDVRLTRAQLGCAEEEG